MNFESIDIQRSVVMSISRQFAIVTGASTGIGLELAKCCAREGFDVLIAADEPQIESTAMEIRALGAIVETVQADLSTTEGLDKLYGASKRMIGCRQCNAGGH